MGHIITAMSSSFFFSIPFFYSPSYSSQCYIYNVFLSSSFTLLIYHRLIFLPFCEQITHSCLPLYTICSHTQPLSCGSFSMCPDGVNTEALQRYCFRRMVRERVFTLMLLSSTYSSLLVFLIIWLRRSIHYSITI